VFINIFNDDEYLLLKIDCLGTKFKRLENFVDDDAYVIITKAKWYRKIIINQETFHYGL
jgi:hypothetical protein